MNTITFPHGGAHPAQSIRRPAGVAGASWRRVARALSVTVGIVGFAGEGFAHAGCLSARA